MFIESFDLRRNVGVGEHGIREVGFRSDCSALDILIRPKSDIDGGIAHSFEKLGTRMLI